GRRSSSCTPGAGGPRIHTGLETVPRARCGSARAVVDGSRQPPTAGEPPPRDRPSRFDVEQTSVLGFGDDAAQAIERRGGGVVAQREHHCRDRKPAVPDTARRAMARRTGSGECSAIVYAEGAQRAAPSWRTDLNWARSRVDQAQPPKRRRVAEHGARPRVEQCGGQVSFDRRSTVPDRVDAGKNTVQVGLTPPPRDAGLADPQARQLSRAHPPPLAGRKPAYANFGVSVPPPGTRTPKFGHAVEVDARNVKEQGRFAANPPQNSLILTKSRLAASGQAGN